LPSAGEAATDEVYKLGIILGYFKNGFPRTSFSWTPFSFLSHLNRLKETFFPRLPHPYYNLFYLKLPSEKNIFLKKNSTMQILRPRLVRPPLTLSAFGFFFSPLISLLALLIFFKPADEC